MVSLLLRGPAQGTELACGPLQRPAAPKPAMIRLQECRGSGPRTPSVIVDQPFRNGVPDLHVAFNSRRSPAFADAGSPAPMLHRRPGTRREAAPARGSGRPRSPSVLRDTARARLHHDPAPPSKPRASASAAASTTSRAAAHRRGRHLRMSRSHRRWVFRFRLEAKCGAGVCGNQGYSSSLEEWSKTGGVIVASCGRGIHHPDCGFSQWASCPPKTVGHGSESRGPCLEMLLNRTVALRSTPPLLQ